VWNKRTGKPARPQIRPISLSSVFAVPSRFRTTSPSRMTDIRLSASCRVDVIGIVRRVRPFSITAHRDMKLVKNLYKLAQDAGP
jgi:hypothetical protein